MNKQEQDAVFTICLMAAFADGDKSEVERDQMQRIAKTLPDADVGAYQRVLLRQVALPEVATGLATPEARRLAYEMALCICQADDSLNDQERGFLAQLRGALGLPEAEAAVVHSQVPPPVYMPAQKGAPPVISHPPGGTDPELERTILNTAILAGALELLPQSVATMAIIPVQVNLVYRVGRSYGFELSKGRIGELLATAGVGITSQVVEGFAQKLFGGLLGKMGGGLGSRIGRQAASSGLSFATTYALGHLARQYYAGGRQFSSVQIKELFGSLNEQARGMYDRYVPAIEDRARSLHPAEILKLARGA